MHFHSWKFEQNLWTYLIVLIIVLHNVTNRLAVSGLHADIMGLGAGFVCPVS